MCHAPCKATARAHATYSLARSRLAGDQSVLEADDRLGLRPPFGPRVTRLKDTLVAKKGTTKRQSRPRERRQTVRNRFGYDAHTCASGPPRFHTDCRRGPSLTAQIAGRSTPLRYKAANEPLRWLCFFAPWCFASSKQRRQAIESKPSWLLRTNQGRAGARPASPLRRVEWICTLKCRCGLRDLL